MLYIHYVVAMFKFPCCGINIGNMLLLFAGFNYMYKEKEGKTFWNVVSDIVSEVNAEEHHHIEEI